MTITRARIQCTIGRATCTAFGDPVSYDAQAGWRVGWPIGEGGVGVPPVTRYQYDGGWGYESGAWGPGRDGQGAVGGPLALWAENTDLPPVTLQHVGERWYAPALGRFLQRDPIGLPGGLNAYAYCDASPLAAVDPEGLEDTPVGDPSPNNPTPYPRPPGSRIRIKLHPPRLRSPGPRIPVPPWLRPAGPVAAVCVAALVGAGVGTAVNNAPRVWGKRKLSEYIGDAVGGALVSYGGWGGDKTYNPFGRDP